MTGYRIGDPVRDEPPAPWLSETKGLVVELVPEWVAVTTADGLTIAGYQRREVIIESGHAQLIWDETGINAIGCLGPAGAVIGTEAVKTCKGAGNHETD